MTPWTRAIIIRMREEKTATLAEMVDWLHAPKRDAELCIGMMMQAGLLVRVPDAPRRWRLRDGAP